VNCGNCRDSIFGFGLWFGIVFVFSRQLLRRKTKSYKGLERLGDWRKLEEVWSWFAEMYTYSIAIGLN